MASRLILPRRTFLRGSLGGIASALALPPLEAMLGVNGDVFADGTPLPTRLGLWFWGNGVRPERWTPKEFGPNWTPSSALAPLGRFADRVSVLSNYEIKHQGTAHHRGRAGILTGTYDPKKGTYGNPTGPSLTYMASKELMANKETRTIRGSFDAGIATRGKSGSNPSNGVVIDESGAFLSVERDPRALFEYFFDGFKPEVDTKTTAAYRKLRGSALNVLMADARDLRRKLGAADQIRLDKHLSGYESLEKNLSAYEEAVCRLSLSTPEGKGSFYKGEDRGKELLREKHAIVADMLVMALTCDLTRVFSITFTTMQSDTILWQVGATEGVHVMTHDDRGLPDDQKLMPQLNRIHDGVVFTMTCFGDLLEKFAAADLGASSLLDQSCILATSELNDGTRHTYESMPLLLAGGANGRLRSGRHVDGKRVVATQVLLTALHATGIKKPALGDDVGRTTSTISDLLV